MMTVCLLLLLFVRGGVTFTHTKTGHANAPSWQQATTATLSISPCCVYRYVL